MTVTLNHKNIVKDALRISKIKPFIDQYNWKEISFPSHKMIRKNFETNNKTIACDIFTYYTIAKKKTKHTYIQKKNIHTYIQSINQLLKIRQFFFFFNFLSVLTIL